MRPQVTDTIHRSMLIEKDLSAGVDAKISTLEKKMYEKNEAIVYLIEAKFGEVLQKVSSNHSYAGAAMANIANDNVAARGQVERRVGQQQQQQTYVVPNLPHHLEVGGQGGARNRSVSPSKNRRRGLTVKL